MSNQWNPEPESDDELTDGAWRFDPWKRVHVWVPAPVVPTPLKRDVSKLLACPTCHAKADQSCRTKNGHTTDSHSNRLIPRQCSCGAPLAHRRKRCDDCCAEAIRERWAAYSRARSARRRMATVTNITPRESADFQHSGGAA